MNEIFFHSSILSVFKGFRIKKYLLNPHLMNTSRHSIFFFLRNVIKSSPLNRGVSTSCRYLFSFEINFFNYYFYFPFFFLSTKMHCRAGRMRSVGLTEVTTRYRQCSMERSESVFHSSLGDPLNDFSSSGGHLLFRKQR